MKKIVLLVMGAMMASSVSAKVVLPKFFTDNMVVQQNAVLTVPGVTTPGAKVMVKTDWKGGSASAKADDKGNFKVSMPTPAAGGPYTIIVSDGSGEDVVLSNVLSGEVWLCSGQSNMEMPIKGWGEVINVDEVVATAQHPDIRLLQIKKNTAFAPQTDAEVNMGGWVESTPGTMNFSAIAYLFALQMHNELGVPVGVIDSSWGGTVAEAWTGYDYLQNVSGFENELTAMKNANFSKEVMLSEYKRLENEWWKGVNDAMTGAAFDLAKYQTGKEWGRMPTDKNWEQTVLPGYDGLVWAQFKVTLPQSAAGKQLELHMCAIDNFDKTYFNGKEVGSANSWQTTRSYTVPGKLVKAGENVITMAIIDFDGEGGFRGPDSDMWVKVDGQTVSIAGDWNYKTGCQLSKMPTRPQAIDGPNFPNVLYNAMIHPLQVMPVKGVLWYQGCSNVGRAAQYETLFQALINDWRHLWKKDMPFYFVQLAGYLNPVNVQPNSEWALLRNSQAKALTLPNTGMAVAIDLGNPVDIHPTNKQEVARRLALIALNRDYGKNCEYAAPVCVSSKVENGKMVLKFNGAVKSTSSALTGFIVGDKSGKFAYANALLQADDTVVVSSPLIEEPIVVRYNWADYPGGNLYGTNGLPIAPFATDK